MCELFTDGEAGVANQANEVRMAGEQADDLILAKPQFAKALLGFGGGAKLADSHRDPRFDAAQRTNFASPFFPALGGG